MKIGISGAANTGKTTLARQLSEGLGLPLIEEKFNQILGSQKLKRSPAEIFTTFNAVLEDKHREEQEASRGFITDRTPVDLYMYLCSMPQPFLNSLASEDLHKFQLRAQALSQSYDYLIIPPFGVVTYNDLATWKAGESRPRMNPWLNQQRHMSFIGTAYSWFPHEKILMVPPEIMRSGKVTEWLVALGGVGAHSSASAN